VVADARQVEEHQPLDRLQLLALLGAVLFQTATNLATTALSSSLQGRHKLGYASITSAIAEVLTQALFVVALVMIARAAAG